MSLKPRLRRPARYGGPRPQGRSDQNEDGEDSEGRERTPGARQEGKSDGAKATPKRIVGLASSIAVLVGLVSSLLTTVFIVQPNLAPTTKNTVEIRNLAIEPGVTLDEYLQHPAVARNLDERQTAQFKRTVPQRLTRVGAVVHFEFEVQGLGGTVLETRWTLFDGESRARLAESEGRDLLPLKFRVNKKEADIGTWETWIDTFELNRPTYFVRLEMYEVGGGTRLTYKDSELFASPGALPPQPQGPP